MTDIFAAVEQYLKNRFPIEWATGEVLSVNTLTALVIVNGSGAGQTCSFNSNMMLQKGDNVLLCRSKLNRLWVVNQVVGSPRLGSSAISQPSANNMPGYQHWSAVNFQVAAGNSWSGTALTDIVSATLQMKGGTPMLIYNGYVTPGGSDVQMDIGWGEGLDYQPIWSQTIKTTVGRTALSITDVLPGKWVGQHTFNVRAQLGTGAITPTLNCTRFVVAEI